MRNIAKELEEFIAAGRQEYNCICKHCWRTLNSEDAPVNQNTGVFIYMCDDCRNMVYTGVEREISKRHLESMKARGK